MKTNRKLTLLSTVTIIAVALSLWAAESGDQGPRPKTAWEHLVFEREGSLVTTDRDLAGTINRLGNEGWEMFNVITVQQDGTTKRLQFYFKRPKS